MTSLKTLAVYPGSFNPWHAGHTNILNKALKCFDKVIIAVGVNPEKPKEDIMERVRSVEEHPDVCKHLGYCDDFFVNVMPMDGLLVDFAKGVGAHAVIRGLRNGHDLQYEMVQQYWNEDLGLEIPIVYFICDRDKAHLSSSMYRALDKFGLEFSRRE